IAAHHLPADHPDRDLIVHLIAAHHGHHRPLLPPVVDPRPPTVHLDGHGIHLPAHTPVDLDAVDRYHALHATYGYWGLALLETIVRHAYHTASRRDEGA